MITLVRFTDGTGRRVRNRGLTCARERAGMVYSGMGPDFRVLVKRGQKSAQTYRLTYGEPIPVVELVRSVARIMQEFTQSGGVRPFGVSLLVCGYDKTDGAQLFQIDPAGTYFAWRASAIGKNMVSAKGYLERRYTEGMDVEDAVHTALMTLREGFEGEVTASNMEMAIATEKGFRILTSADIADYLSEAE